MKYTIEGFSQKEMLKKDMDTVDAVILRWFIDFKDTGKMYSEIINGDKFYWVKYDQVLKDIPIVNLGKEALARRLKKMANNKILSHYTKKINGTFSMYTVGEGFTYLINCDEKSDGTTLKSDGYDSKVVGGTTLESEGVRLESRRGYDSKVGTNNSSIKENKSIKETNLLSNSSTNNNNMSETVKDLWNDICKSYSKVIKLSTTREKHINLRLKEMKQDIEMIKETFVKLENSSFCKGINEKRWKASLDWLFSNDTNIIKVLEGKYDDADSKLSTKENKILSTAKRWLENQNQEGDVLDVE